jgi:hypothetical protein
VLENRLLRRIFGPKTDEVKGGWRKLRNEQFRDLYASPTIIRMLKSGRVRWEKHEERMGRRRTGMGYWWESQRERDH